ncbi:MAG: arginase family protein [Gemmatimonadales bacterium]
MRVELIAVPYDSGRRGERMGAGPERIIEAGLGSRLLEAGHQAQVRIVEAPPESWRAEIRTAFDLAEGVALAVADAVGGDRFPLVLSGNCTPAALGCIAGLRRSPTVFWFDAHGDFNTPDTTIGGFLDGMALATSTGRCWPHLSTAIPGFEPVGEESVALLGARDLDPLEAVALDASAVRRVRPAELRSRLPAVLRELHGDSRPAYLHLDLDVLDPGEGRINSYSAPGGLSLAESAWAIGAIADAVPLGAAALTALDPSDDPRGRGLEAALTLGVAIVDAAARHRAGSVRTPR